MGVSKIKKSEMPQVDPATIPGYNTPPELTGQPGARIQAMQQARQLQQQQVGRAFPAQGTSATQPRLQELGYDLRPAQSPPIQPRRVWVSRHFKTAEIDQIGQWLTEIEEKTGVLGIAPAYAPGGVAVMVQTREDQRAVVGPGPDKFSVLVESKE